MTEAGAADAIFSVWVARVTTGKEAQRSQRDLRRRMNGEALTACCKVIFLNNAAGTSERALDLN